MGEENTKRICLLSDIRIREVVSGIEYLWKSDSEGSEVGPPINYQPCDSDFRYYTCVNCGFLCDGSKTFNEMRSHIGKINPYLNPFGESLSSQHLKTSQLDLIPDFSKNTSH